ncbi:MAG TPA: response regulator [Gemmatimonadales bacterium]|jgi:diguanylate cyclase (GGDEF)-like protein|nr:response regulator [Gemmatimonadales bacterium]
MARREPAEVLPLVLIANDQEWSARSLESILAPNGYAVTRAHTGRQAMERARQESPDLIILDAQMPDMHGFDVCRHLRDDPRFGPSTPILITTAGPSGRAQRLEAYRAGAWEFLGQPVDGEALLLKMRTFIQAKVATDALRDESLLDSVSGFYNMRGLARRAREIGSEAQRRHYPLAAVVFASDSGLPDELSDEDEEVLAEHVGQVFRQAGRVSDAVGRLGANEFGVIAPATGPDAALQMVNRLGSSFDGTSVQLAGAPRRLRLQAGYCAVDDFAKSDADAVELLLRATTALRDLRDTGSSERARGYVEEN